MSYTLPFEQVELSDIAEVGGKNASLGELTQRLASDGIAVPRGFALRASAFREHLIRAGLAEHIYDALDAVDPNDVAALAALAGAIRRQVCSAPLPADVVDALLAAYRELSRSYGEEETDVAVRSSATAEDLPTASFAGQQESYLNVRGAAALVEAVRYDIAFTFVYSPRTGTEAASMPDQVPHELKIERMERLVETVQRIAHENNERRVGLVEEVLVEGPSRTDETVLRGRTRRNTTVVFAGDALPGELVPVRIDAATSTTLRGVQHAAVAA